MNKYATDCTALDMSRRKLLDCIRETIKAAGEVQRRIKQAYGHAMSVEAQEALIEQRQMAYNLTPALVDFIDYMDEPRAWAPALPEPPNGFDFVTQSNSAMDELLGKL